MPLLRVRRSAPRRRDRQGRPGLVIQPAIWEGDRFALVAIDDVPEGFARLLPLVEHADDLRAAAGLEGGVGVEINSPNLGLVLRPGESDAYLALLTGLADDRAVRSFWADDASAQSDGVAKVQIVAPDEWHADIQEDVRSSGLRIADWPMRFIER